MKQYWISLVMIASSIPLFYAGWAYLHSLPQDRKGELPFTEKTVGVYMVLSSIGLGFFGMIWAKHLCETSLKYRNNTTDVPEE